MRAEDFFNPEDTDFIIQIRREIHKHPELKFDLPITLSVVRRELNKIGVQFTERYGKSSIVVTINPDCKGPTIGIRADMDALPIQEKTGLPYSSVVPGVMHACGHDCHTAMLLGTAKALKRAEHILKCRVKLIFQPCEEGPELGSFPMVQDGVMDDIDYIIALHIWNKLDTGYVGVAIGEAMAACHSYEVEFFGKSAHSSMPHTGCDALAMAVTAYNSIYLFSSRRIPPLKKHTINFGCLHAGWTHNVMPDYAKMLFNFRWFDKDLNDQLDLGIREACESAARLFGGTSKITSLSEGKPVINDEALARRIIESGKNVLGDGGVVILPPELSSEDFSEYLAKKPGVFIRLGSRNAMKGATTDAHNNDFTVDEDSFILGSKLCVQFVLDQSDKVNVASEGIKV
ncbi:MAG TPA: M20 family metallopeptidase [Sphaerochaeta sp.]|nr:M20 family metallopeptidase [Sphaerochaeta sp.]HQB05196.1 M20 family metallopeptidase [Sphaerochaeta sp.]